MNERNTRALLAALTKLYSVLERIEAKLPELYKPEVDDFPDLAAPDFPDRDDWAKADREARVRREAERKVNRWRKEDDDYRGG